MGHERDKKIEKNDIVTRVAKKTLQKKYPNPPGLVGRTLKKVRSLLWRRRSNVLNGMTVTVLQPVNVDTLRFTCFGLSLPLSSA